MYSEFDNGNQSSSSNLSFVAGLFAVDPAGTPSLTSSLPFGAAR